MEPASVTIQLTAADIQRFHRFVGGPWFKRWRGVILLILVVTLLCLSYVASGSRHERERFGDAVDHPAKHSSTDFLAPALILGGLFLFFFYRARWAANYKKVAPSVFLPTTYTVFEEGLFLQNDRGEMLHYWKIMVRFTEEADYLFLLVTARTGYILPKRCFSTPEAAGDFAAQVRSHLEKHAPAALAARQP